MWLRLRKKQTEQAPTLAELFRDARRNQEMSRKECACAAGYRNVVKGCRRLCEIERDEAAFPDERVLARFATALHIPDEDVRRAQRTEVERHDQPISPQVLVHWAPKITAPLDYPAGLKPKQVVKFATKFARAHHTEVFVKLSDVRGVSVGPDGAAVETVNIPWERLDGRLPEVSVDAA
jgi:transcriptional regulator with XRE-family HTH domain